MSDDTPGTDQGALLPREGCNSLRTSAERPTTMRLTQVAGQYVLSPQTHGVPALTQISSASVSGVQSGVTRIISISPSRGQTSSMRPSLTNQSIVNVLKSRNSNSVKLQLLQNNDMLNSATLSSHTTTSHSRPLKRSASVSEKKDSFAAKSQRVTNHMLVRSKLVKEKYAEHLLEDYFLRGGGNILEFYQFAKRPKTDRYMAYMKEYSIESKEPVEEVSTTPTAESIPRTPSATEVSSLPGISRSRRQSMEAALSTPSAPAVNVKSSTSGNTNQDHMAEKVKQEAYVVNRIADLQREGLWSEKRLPKVQEMPRGKAHWDYLLEEMVWLAADFAQERKWKKAAAKKCARMVQKYFQEKAAAAQKAEKAHELHLRRIAALCAKEVKTFWNSVEKLVEYKQNTILDEKRKKALDQQLSFIVDQTEKYSQLLAEGMNKSNVEVASNVSSKRTSRNVSDDEFDPDVQSEEDDEETIEQEEATAANGYDQSKEVEALQRESQMELDDLLEDKFLRDYLLNRDKIRLSESENSDDENSIEEDTDKRNSGLDHEIPCKIRKIEKESDSEAEDDVSDSEEFASGDEGDEGQKEEESLNLLVGDGQILDGEEVKTDKKGDLINDAAAIAESIQPKGNTLSSTTVSTNVPFLLKLPLREYQHIGLDWLVTMYERKLNGILADEMGLGKTIQTIALLAHLACEKGNWGPHLIVVPTSVMLNWEMECKKWCPAFKILTYYGSQKERRLKRTGWTKPNSFHICITSYKLVIQDQQSFRRKKWKYLILDEAQNIKNFKSQRWQLLLNFQTDRRLLLTGTPLQNNLMELWSLMHFLMPNVFQSHREFNEWFSNPVTGMIEGNSEYNENIIKRLHKVLRPFLLRRLKSEVEKQMPKKYEHVVMCRLSKRQRFLYDDYMSRTKTKATLASGNLLSVINALMQLRKVCNHPNLFEPRPTISPLQSDNIKLHIPSIVYAALSYDVFKHVNLYSMNLLLIMLEMHLGAYQCFHLRQSAKRSFNIHSSNEFSSPLPPPCKLAMKVRIKEGSTDRSSMPSDERREPANVLTQTTIKPNMKVKLSGVQLVPQGIVKAIPLVNISQASGQVQVGTPINMSSVLKPVDKLSASFAQLVQTPTGKHLLLTSNPNIPVTSTASCGPKLTFLSKPTTIPATGNTPSLTKAFLKVQLGSVTGTGTATRNSTACLLTSKGEDCLRSVPSNFLGQLYSKQNNVDVRLLKDDRKSNITQREKIRIESKRNLMKHINERRCSALPLYGKDFQDCVKISKPNKRDVWSGGYVSCLNGLYSRHVDDTTSFLNDVLYNPQKRIEQLKDICDRFIFYVPAVKANEPELRVWHPSPSEYWARKEEKKLIQRLFSKPATPLHHIASAMVTQFPDPRLIQYDCGKLQIMDKLLRELKAGNHRILIFTQMTKMLDVLEVFLNIHGYIYLRLDGTTKIDQRQVLMERFNGDKRIFAFILSTRSGGVGVNLTGADTVIFYDSDWNPTMDAQAQDRCHRIGQTRDVHIYRLISERTIEENILKKANQKRLLGDLAIEGGNFTTAYFKKTTIQDLFDIDGTAETAAQRISNVVDKSRSRDKAISNVDSSAANDEKSAIGALENALAFCEDDQDVQAANTAKAEAVADLAEFDENIPLDVDDRDQEISKAEQEINNILEKLTPIEKYAMKFIEQTESAWSAEQLAAATRQIEEQKREWEANQMAAMREEEERRAREIEEENDAITFTREDATNQVWISENTMEQMPIWCPPTPPQDEEETYVDQSMLFLYDKNIMTESQLPPIYAKKEGKHRFDPIYGYEYKRPMKISKRPEPTPIPKSLFHSPALMKMKRDMKLQKCRGLLRTSSTNSLSSASSTKSIDNSVLSNWLRHDEGNFFKGVHRLQPLFTNQTTRPGHIPNFDLLADMVNTGSFTYRSSKIFRYKYEATMLNREEEKLALVENSGRKRKKNVQLPRMSPFYKSRTTSRSGLSDEDNRSAIKTLKERVDCLVNESTKTNPTESTIGLNNSSSFQTPPISNMVDLTTPNNCSTVEPERKVDILEIAMKSMENILTKKAGLDKKNSRVIVTTPQQAQKIVAMSLAAHQNSGTMAVPVTQAVVPPSPVATSAVTVVGTSAVSTNTLRSQRIITSPMQNPTVVSIAGLVPAQLPQGAQRLTVLAGTSNSQVKNVIGTPTCVTSKHLTPAQLHMLRQASLKSQIRIHPNALPQGSKTSTVTIGGQPAVVQFGQAQQRPQFIRQGAVTVAGKASGLVRAANENEVAIVFKKPQPKLTAATATGTVQTSNVSGNIMTSQVFAQAIQQASTSGTQVATIVKAIPANSSGMSQTVTLPVTGVTLATASGKSITPTVKTATSQQIQQMQIRQQLLAQKKLAANAQKLSIAQVAGKSNMQAQLIVGPKPLPTTMTVQQFQQVIKSTPLSVPQSPVILTKGGSRVIPVNTGQGGKQTIQVVAASSQAINSALRTQNTTSISGIKLQNAVTSSQQAALLSQVSAALNQNISVRQNSPVRLQTSTGQPVVSVTVQSAPPSQNP